MRRNSLLKNSTKSSICSFCSTRASANAAPRRIQRRLLHQSRANQNPILTLTAGNAATSDANTRPSAAESKAWSQTVGGPATSRSRSSSTWGSSFGKSRDSVAQGDSISSQAGSRIAELSPEEEYARRLIQEREAKKRPAPRPIQIYAGAGPEHTRAGRPIPNENYYRQNAKSRTLQDLDSSANEGEWPQIRKSSRLFRKIQHESPTDQTASEGRNSDTRESNPGRPPPIFRFTSAYDHAPPATDRDERLLGQSIGSRPESARRTEIRDNNSEQLLRTAARQDSTVPNTTKPQRPFRLYTPDAEPKPERPRFSSRQESQNALSTRQMPESRPTEADAENFPRRVNVFESPRNRFPSSRQTETDITNSPRQVDSRGPYQSRFSANPSKRQTMSDVTSSPRQVDSRASSSSRSSINSSNSKRAKDKERRRQSFADEDDEDDISEQAVLKAELKRKRRMEKAALKAAAPTPILLPEYISVSNLATALSIRVEKFVEKMEELGFENTSTDYILNSENAGLIAQEYNFEPIIDRGQSADLKAQPPPEDTSVLQPRPPVVTIMGHVDHGKTTLLDWLRKSSIAATEHGGITQHIGAFSVPMSSGKIVTFLDTPGHAAFLSMRQRGANVTDIVILVVAADDSVKPQTIEAINHAQAAKVPIIVAINKIDKDDSNIDRVKQDLARHGVQIEDYGGDTQVVCVSGKTGQGMDELEEAAGTLSEILDLRADADGPVEGWVLEASVKSAGKVATVLVKRGTLRPGDIVVAGHTWARVRNLRNEAGADLAEAGPGYPAQIDGWRDQPAAGDEVLQAGDEARAKAVIDYRLERVEQDKMAEDMEAINESRRAEQARREREKREAELAAAAEDSEAGSAAARGEEEEAAAAAAANGPKVISFIVKADVSGSVEAVSDSISALGNNEVRAQVLRSGVGQLSEFDVEHAATAGGHLVSFNSAVEPGIRRMAAGARVAVLDHNVIYRLVDAVRSKLEESLPPLVSQRVLGEAEIAQLFEISARGRARRAIAGCKVRNGVIARNARVRVLRRGSKIFDGTLSSLKNLKKDVTEVRKGGECGMGFMNWADFEVGDQVQGYEEVEEKRYL